MENWRELILKEFTPQVARITLVADPDALISEEVIVQEIQSRGFELVVYEDPIALRYLYESRYRLGSQNGDAGDLVILVRDDAQRFSGIPYDISSAARKITTSLERLFPHLNRAVLQALDRSFFDTLYQAQIIYAPHQLSENATKDFVLRHVFEIAPEMIKTHADLLRVLLRKHYGEQRVPAMLDDWLIHMLRKSGRFTGWDLEAIISERAGFLSFLQERWPAYLKSLETGPLELVKDVVAAYHPVISGPELLPFDHNDVRVYIDNLFAEGWLKPVSLHDLKLSSGTGGLDTQRYPTWARMGIRSDPEIERQVRLQKILKTIEDTFQPENARHSDWIALAAKWAEVNVLWHTAKKTSRHYNPAASGYEDLGRRIDEHFTAWMIQRFGSLYNLPAADPVMVHHIPRCMAKALKTSDTRAALILLDGFAFDQWVAIRAILERQVSDVQFTVTGSFAWVPTLTSVSRQAIFAGKAPLYFPERIWDNKAEPGLWSQFWMDAGLAEYQIRFLRGTGEQTGLDALVEEITDPKTRVIGLVIDKVDKIMHGIELGASGMINQVRQWTEQGYLGRLIKSLIDQDYLVFISSDHGNIEATGCGRPAEGAAADLRGERVRIYPDETLRSAVQANYPQSIAWKPSGLPTNYYPLLASGRTAFVSKDKRVVSHGGISIEEVIVPFIRIEKR